MIGMVLLFLGASLPEGAQEAYQTAVVLIAAALIVQMVVWMRRHGRTLKRDLETSLSGAASNSQWWGVFTLALLAVAREGSETVIFLYGVLTASHSDTTVWIVRGIATGFGAAIATYYALQLGSRLFSWRVFFRVTEVMLLLLGGALILTGVDNLTGLGMLPAAGHLWDTSGLLAEDGTLGRLAVSFFGYRARPDLVELASFAAYWMFVLWLISSSAPAAKRATEAA